MVTEFTFAGTTTATNQVASSSRDSCIVVGCEVSDSVQFRSAVVGEVGTAVKLVGGDSFGLIVTAVVLMEIAWVPLKVVI